MMDVLSCAFCSHLVCARPFCSSFFLDAQSPALSSFTAICCKMMTQWQKEKTMNENRVQQTAYEETQRMRVTWMLQTPHFVVTAPAPARFVASSLLLEASLEEYRNEKETGKNIGKREQTRNKKNTDTIENAYSCLLSLLFFFSETTHFCVAQLAPIHFVTKWLFLDSFLEFRAIETEK